jgi:hypothetical protein
VQILVVVAITQMRLLRTEVGNGSETTEIDLGLVGPKSHGNSVNCAGLLYLLDLAFFKSISGEREEG